MRRLSAALRLTHGGTGVTPNQAYSDASKAEHARQVMQAQAKRNAPRPRSLQGHRNCVDGAKLPDHGHRAHRHGAALHSEGLARQ